MPKTERLDDATAHLEFQRVVAEQTEVAGPLPGVMPGAAAIMRPWAESLAIFVEVRRRGGLSGVR